MQWPALQGAFLFSDNENEYRADVSKIICILIIFTTHLIAVRYKISLPQFYNQLQQNDTSRLPG